MPITNRNRHYSQPGMRLQLPSEKRRFPRKIVICVVVLILVIAIAKGVTASGDKEPTQSNVHAATEVNSPNKQPQKIKKVVDTSALSSTLSNTIKHYPYDTSVSVVDLNSGQLYQSGDSYPFMAASTTKLLTALLYLNNVEGGQASLKDTIGDNTADVKLKAMITDSDNDAWLLLNDHLNRDSLEMYAKKQGLQSYDVTKNIVTSNDMAQLLAKLYNRDLLNEEHTKLLLSWMQHTSEERFIPPAVPQSETLYHKSGFLEDRVHDVAIVDNGSTPFAIVIYSKTYGGAAYNFDIGQKLFNDVTTNVINIFNK